MYLDCTCSDITIEKWNRLMTGAKIFTYKKLIDKIKKELPDIYADLSLNLKNPWSGDTKQTKTHYILVHSSVEYFFRKGE